MKAPSKKVKKKPMAILVYGVEGVGKTTFALKAPNCVLLGTENGSDELDVPTPGSFDPPKTWMEFMDQLRWLQNNPHDYETVVIDSIDWLEPLVEADVLANHPGHTMETVLGGFQAGWKATTKYWRSMTAELSKLRDKGMGIVLIAHADAAKFVDAANQAEYSKYQLKLYKPAAAHIKEWVDAILFANFEISVDAKKNQKARASGTGERRMYTEHRPGFDAKNRYGLPSDMEFSWEAFAGVRGFGKSPDEIKAKIEALLPSIEEPGKADSIKLAMDNARDNIPKLESYLLRVEQIIEKQGAKA